MVQLNASTLSSVKMARGVAPKTERVIQFGEGGFLRAFCDWMIDMANEKAGMDAGVVIVQPIERGMVSMQGLGYKEILDYLDGVIPLEEAVRILKRDTRHFAKRQLTWFRREPETIWVNKETFGYDEGKLLEYVLEQCRKGKIIG